MDYSKSASYHVTKVHVQKIVGTFLCLLLLPLISGCGDGEASSGDADVRALLKGPQQCLAALGASDARAVSQIQFYIDDSEKGDAVKPAGAGDGVVVVSEYRPVTSSGPSDGRPLPGYVVWVGHGEATVGSPRGPAG
jgi:hypothetical protein